jgi:hypothetical protein
VPEGVYFTPIITFRINGDAITHTKTPMSADEIHALLLRDHMSTLVPVSASLATEQWTALALPPLRVIYYALVTIPSNFGYPIGGSTSYNNTHVFIRNMKNLIRRLRELKMPCLAYLIKIVDGICVPFDTGDMWLCKNPLRFKEIYTRNNEHDPLRPAK